MLNPFLALREVTWARPLYLLHERWRSLRATHNWTTVPNANFLWYTFSKCFWIFVYVALSFRLALPSKVRTSVHRHASAPTLWSLTKASIVSPILGQSLTILLTLFDTLRDQNLLSAIALARNRCARRLIAFRFFSIIFFPASLIFWLFFTFRYSSGSSDSDSDTTSPLMHLARRYCSYEASVAETNARWDCTTSSNSRWVSPSDGSWMKNSSIILGVILSSRRSINSNQFNLLSVRIFKSMELSGLHRTGLHLETFPRGGTAI